MAVKMVHIDNRMAVDSEWECLERTCRSTQPPGKKGYTELHTSIFVPKENAYGYAMERIRDDKGLQEEFVEWFYSGDWIEED